MADKSVRAPLNARLFTLGLYGSSATLALIPNEAIKVGNDTEEQVDVATSVKRVTKVVSSGPQRVVLVDDVVFVNNGPATTNGIEAGRASGTGSAEQPVDTLQAGENVAVANSIATNRLWHVYTQGGVNYTGGVTMPAGGPVKFIGSGMPVAGVGGRTFGTGQMPTLVNASFTADNGGNYFGVYGYGIQNGIISSHNHVTFEAVGNVLSGVQTGISSFTDTIPLANVLIHGNRVSTPTSFTDALVSVTGEGASHVVATVTQNDLTQHPGHATSVYLFNLDSATMDVTVAGNQVLGGNSGMYITQAGGRWWRAADASNHIAVGPPSSGTGRNALRRGVRWQAPPWRPRHRLERSDAMSIHSSGFISHPRAIFGVARIL